MATGLKRFSLWLLRLGLVWVVNALSLAGAAWLLPGMTFQAVGATSQWAVIVAAALVLAVVNLLLRPIVLVLARPLGWIALFVIGLILNIVTLAITAWLLPGFSLTFWAAIFGGFAFAIFNNILSGVLELDEEGSFYQQRIERLAARQPYAEANSPNRALMMVEFDGLSYHHIRKALERGLMPNLQRLIDEEGYQLSKVDCGMPSMTSACQAGIMFGDNYDIPAYRWYNKDEQRLYVSASDAPTINSWYAHGQGLMRGGSSIMNLTNGDAVKSIFTNANMFGGTAEDKRRRANDVQLLMLDPYFLFREVIIFAAETGRELWEGWQQKRRNVEPRINRLHGWYPFIRAAMCTLMRDMCANVAVMDMMRGSPSIYMLYLGYDEVAHHSGPWTDDAFGDLRRSDHFIGRLHRIIKEKAPRYYELVILSDHGQSFGPTFLQRYGLTIKEFIEQQLPSGVSVAQDIGGDDARAALRPIASELTNVSESDSNAFSKAVAEGGQRLVEAGIDASDALARITPASVTAYGSGNAAQVYFDVLPRKIKLSELNEAYPKLIPALVAHEGLGMVIGYADDMSPVVLGKGGSRNLNTGEVVGEDPVKPYAPDSGWGAAPIEKRVWQLKRVMDFPHAGDLWLISTVYPDGTVAALEELIGNHGGVGGEQTDAFILHPNDMEVPDTRNSTDVFHILNAQRAKPIPDQRTEQAPIEKQVDSWSLATLGRGIAQVGVWFPVMLRCIMLDRRAYREVANNPFMTGPALLITVLALLLREAIRPAGFSPTGLLTEIVGWLIGVAAVFGAGYLLGKKGNYTRTFRVMGFAAAAFFIVLLAAIPGLASLAHALAVVVFFVAVWVGAAIAHELRGWRGLVLPIVAVLVTVVAVVIGRALLQGVTFAWDAILGDAGITPQ